jgi:hypothetical protein
MRRSRPRRRPRSRGRRSTAGPAWWGPSTARLPCCDRWVRATPAPGTTGQRARNARNPRGASLAVSSDVVPPRARTSPVMGEPPRRVKRCRRRRWRPRRASLRGSASRGPGARPVVRPGHAPRSRGATRGTDQVPLAVSARGFVPPSSRGWRCPPGGARGARPRAAPRRAVTEDFPRAVRASRLRRALTGSSRATHRRIHPKRWAPARARCDHGGHTTRWRGCRDLRTRRRVTALRARWRAAVHCGHPRRVSAASAPVSGPSQRVRVADKGDTTAARAPHKKSRDDFSPRAPRRGGLSRWAVDSGR